MSAVHRIQTSLDLIKADDPGQAGRILRTVAAEDPGSAAAFHLLGVVAEREADPERAMRLIVRALRLDPGSPLVQQNFANIVGIALRRALDDMREGRTEPATRVLRAVLEAAPGTPDALHLLGLIEVRAGDPRGVERVAEALRRLPSLPGALGNLHRAIDSGFPEDGTAEQKALRRGLDDTLRSLHDHCIIEVRRMLAQGQATEALALVGDILQGNPGNVDAYLLGTIALWKKGDHDRALTAFFHLLRHEPDHADALYSLGCMHRERGAPGRASIAFRRALGQRPDWAEARAMLDGCVVALGGPAALDYYPSETCQVSVLADIYRSVLGYRTDGTFVEIGAFDGETYSNTAFLADIGWRGVYVEPVPLHADLCERRHRHNRVEVVRAAVGAAEGSARISVAGPLSSMADDHIESFKSISWSAGFHKDDFIDVPVITPAALLERTGIDRCDVLVIDVEGLERPIVESWPFDRLKPRIAIIETRDHTDEFGEQARLDSLEVIRIMEANGYVQHWREVDNIVFLHQG